MNTGDIIYQMISFVFLLGICAAVFYLIRSLTSKKNKSKQLEQKLDRIIDLLEKDKRE